MRLRQVSLAPLGIIALLSGCLLLAGGPAEILAGLPLALLALALAFDRYPGERAIARIAARRSRARRAGASRRLLPPPAPASWAPRGARLLAFALAKRPPPVHRLAQT